MVRFLVVYDTPEDPEAFDRHYREVHIPLATRTPSDGQSDGPRASSAALARWASPPFRVLGACGPGTLGRGRPRYAPPSPDRLDNTSGDDPQHERDTVAA